MRFRNGLSLLSGFLLVLLVVFLGVYRQGSEEDRAGSQESSPRASLEEEKGTFSTDAESTPSDSPLDE